MSHWILGKPAFDVNDIQNIVDAVVTDTAKFTAVAVDPTSHMEPQVVKFDPAGLTSYNNHRVRISTGGGLFATDWVVTDDANTNWLSFGQPNGNQVARWNSGYLGCHEIDMTMNADDTGISLAFVPEVGWPVPGSNSIYYDEYDWDTGAWLGLGDTGFDGELPSVWRDGDKTWLAYENTATSEVKIYSTVDNGTNWVLGHTIPNADVVSAPYNVEIDGLKICKVGNRLVLIALANKVAGGDEYAIWHIYTHLGITTGTVAWSAPSAIDVVTFDHIRTPPTPDYNNPPAGPGTVEVAGVAVTGVGTIFLDTFEPYDYIRTDSGGVTTHFRIVSITDNTNLVIAAPGAVVAPGATYCYFKNVVIRHQSLFDVKIDRTNTLVLGYSNIVDDLIFEDYFDDNSIDAVAWTEIEISGTVDEVGGFLVITGDGELQSNASYDYSVEDKIFSLNVWSWEVGAFISFEFELYTNAANMHSLTYVNGAWEYIFDGGAPAVDWDIAPPAFVAGTKYNLEIRCYANNDVEFCIDGVICKTKTGATPENKQIYISSFYTSYSGGCRVTSSSLSNKKGIVRYSDDGIYWYEQLAPFVLNPASDWKIFDCGMFVDDQNWWWYVIKVADIVNTRQLFIVNVSKDQGQTWEYSTTVPDVTKCLWNQGRDFIWDGDLYADSIMNGMCLGWSRSRMAMLWGGSGSNDYMSIAMIFADSFDSYNNASLSGQGGWTRYGGGVSHTLVESTVYQGATGKAIISDKNYNDLDVKDGTSLTDGGMSFYVRIASYIPGGINAAFLQVAPYVTGAIPWTNDCPVYFRYAGIYARNTFIQTWVVNHWYCVEMEWRSSPDYKYRVRIDGGAWIAWQAGDLPAWPAGLGSVLVQWYYSDGYNGSYTGYVDQITGYSIPNQNLAMIIGGDRSSLPINVPWDHMWYSGSAHKPQDFGWTENLPGGWSSTFSGEYLSLTGNGAASHGDYTIDNTANASYIFANSKYMIGFQMPSNLSGDTLNFEWLLDVAATSHQLVRLEVWADGQWRIYFNGAQIDAGTGFTNPAEWEIMVHNLANECTFWRRLRGAETWVALTSVTATPAAWGGAASCTLKFEAYLGVAATGSMYFLFYFQSYGAATEDYAAYFNDSDVLPGTDVSLYGQQFLDKSKGDNRLRFTGYGSVDDDNWMLDYVLEASDLDKRNALRSRPQLAWYSPAAADQTIELYKTVPEAIPVDTLALVNTNFRSFKLQAAVADPTPTWVALDYDTTFTLVSEIGAITAVGKASITDTTKAWSEGQHRGKRLYVFNGGTYHEFAIDWNYENRLVCQGDDLPGDGVLVGWDYEIVETSGIVVALGDLAYHYYRLLIPDQDVSPDDALQYKLGYLWLGQRSALEEQAIYPMPSGFSVREIRNRLRSGEELVQATAMVKKRSLGLTWPLASETFKNQIDGIFSVLEGRWQPFILVWDYAADEFDFLMVRAVNYPSIARQVRQLRNLDLELEECL